MKFRIIPLLFLLIMPLNIKAQDNNSDNKLVIVRKFIDNFCNKIINISANKELSDSKKILNLVDHIDNSINSKWISRFVLGSNYRNMTNEQITRFNNIYRQYMIKTYSPKFKKYNSYGVNITSVEKFQRFYLVETSFDIESSKDPVEINFRVKLFNDKFLIIDIIAEGISLVETQRSEFGAAISSNGIEKFIDMMNDKLVKLENIDKKEVSEK